MPRDLFPPQHPVLTESPEPQDAFSDEPGLSMHMRNDSDQAHEHAIFGGDEMDERDLELSRSFRRNDDLHPLVQGLSISDIDACVALENSAFPPNERCSREKLYRRLIRMYPKSYILAAVMYTYILGYPKSSSWVSADWDLAAEALIFEYRLTACPTLSIGVFSTTEQKPTPETQEAYDAARAPDSFSPEHKSILIGQVIATMTAADRVTDASMEIPAGFSFSSVSSKSPPVPAKEPSPTPLKSDSVAQDTTTDKKGYDPQGRTIVIHSVCVLPTFQGTGLGKMILRSYLQRMESSGIADQAALLAHPEMIGWYTDNFGFEDQGESKVTFGGGGWHDMTYSFTDGLWS